MRNRAVASLDILFGLETSFDVLICNRLVTRSSSNNAASWKVTTTSQNQQQNNQQKTNVFNKVEHILILLLKTLTNISLKQTEILTNSVREENLIIMDGRYVINAV